MRNCVKTETKNTTTRTTKQQQKHPKCTKYKNYLLKNLKTVPQRNSKAYANAFNYFKDETIWTLKVQYVIVCVYFLPLAFYLCLNYSLGYIETRQFTQIG